MRIMMTDAHLDEPTFESVRGANTFTIRLLRIIFLERMTLYGVVGLNVII
jgi:hypothetical protein